METLKIVTWNANGLSQHIPELEIFLVNESIDICLVSETHLKKESKVKIKNYVCYHTPHPENTSRGGSAVIIRSHIQHHQEAEFSNELFQISIISIQAQNRQMKVAAIYCPPRNIIPAGGYADIFKMLGNNFIIGGDLNAKHTFWGSRQSTNKGKKLYLAGRKHKCEFFSSGEPTYWPSDPGKTPALIDFFITKGISRKHVIVESRMDLSSDHTPVLLTISEKIISKEGVPRLCSKKTDWNKFRKRLEQLIGTETIIETVSHIDLEVDQFISNLQTAAKLSTPPIPNKVQTAIKYPADVLRMIKDKRKARKKWHTTRYPEDKIEFNRLNNLLKRKIWEAKNNKFRDFINNLTANQSTDYSLWKCTRNLQRPQIHESPLRTQDGKWISDPRQKANLFADHLAEVFKPLPRNDDEENITLINKNDEDEIPYVSLKELKNVCRVNLNNKKSPGHDLITGQIIKQLPDLALLKLQYIINACFRLRYVPKLWKTAEVIVIPKPGKPTTEVSSYRPIPLLPIMSKIFEKILLKRLNNIIEERQLLPNHQFGFRANHSTIDQVHRITDKIEKAFEMKKVCTAVFLDVAQAFDRVWHEGLEYKLHRDLPRQYYEILKSYLADRNFKVRYGTRYSELKQIMAGVPKGSVLGPTLYLLYTRDLVVDQQVMMATFADDTAVIVAEKNIDQSTRKLQNALNEITRWTRKWRIKLNETKSTHINFTYNKINSIPLTINNRTIPYANTAKYLGMNLDAKLKGKEHIKKKKEELNIKYRKLYWLLGRNSELSVENKIRIYNQILKPIWTYGIQMWGCSGKSNTHLIHTVQNKVLRSIVNAPWYVRNKDLHRDLQIETVAEVTKKYAIKHYQRLQSQINPEMEKVINRDNTPRRLKRTKPYELMD